MTRQKMIPATLTILLALVGCDGSSGHRSTDTGASSDTVGVGVCHGAGAGF